MAPGSVAPRRDARLLVALALAASALAGCAGGLRRTAPPVRDAEPEPIEAIEPAPDPLESERAARAEAEARERARREREQRQRLPGRVHAQVATRMPRHDASVHQRVAGAVLSESRRARMDPLLVLAVIHVESSFDPRAVSRAGAMGLMQVRGPTLREEMKRARLRFTDAFDPLTNVQAGVRYLRRLLDRFGELEVALMAYNAGPNRMRKLLSRGEIPPRIQAYPRKVARELERLQVALGVGPSPERSVVATK